VVSRISGGLSRWRVRFAAAYRRCGSRSEIESHLSTGRLEIALDIDGQCLERRDVERVDALERPSPAFSAAAVQRDHRRQEAGQRLAGAGGRDQQRRLAPRRLVDQRQLVLARRPALGGEPAGEGLRQHRHIHVSSVARYPSMILLG
jgi:hypothetical protein